MKQNSLFHIVFSDVSKNQMQQSQQLEFFALLNLGLVQSLASGILSATEAIQRFYNAENCLYVRTGRAYRCTSTER